MKNYEKTLHAYGDIDSLKGLISSFDDSVFGEPIGDIFTSPYEELPSVTLQSGYLEADNTALTVCLVAGVILVPVALLTTGIVIWIRRKRR